MQFNILRNIQQEFETIHIFVCCMKVQYLPFIIYPSTTLHISSCTVSTDITTKLKSKQNFVIAVLLLLRHILQRTFFVTKFPPRRYVHKKFRKKKSRG